MSSGRDPFFRSIVIRGSRCYRIDIRDLEIVTIPLGPGVVGVVISCLCKERFKIVRAFVKHSMYQIYS